MALLSEGVSKIAVRGTTKKQQGRGVMARVKPGASVVQARAAWDSSSLPRSIRLRGSPRKAPKPGRGLSPASPSSPHQEAAVSSAGKVALGPWLGPFNPSPQKKPEVLPSTMYMDTRGFVHFGLNSEEHQSIMQAIRAMQEPAMSETGGSGIGSRVEATELALRMEAVRADRMARSCQAAALQRVPIHSTGRGQRAVKQMHLINQPRRFY